MIEEINLESLRVEKLSTKLSKFLFMFFLFLSFSSLFPPLFLFSSFILLFDNVKPRVNSGNSLLPL